MRGSGRGSAGDQECGGAGAVGGEWLAGRGGHGKGVDAAALRGQDSSWISGEGLETHGEDAEDARGDRHGVDGLNEIHRTYVVELIRFQGLIILYGTIRMAL